MYGAQQEKSLINISYEDITLEEARGFLNDLGCKYILKFIKFY